MEAPLKKTMSFRLDPDLHRRLRIVLLYEDRGMQNLFESFVTRYVEAKEEVYGKPGPPGDENKVPVEA